MITENLTPKSVFYHFEKLSEIPHGSGNEKGVSDYCVDFAIKHGLWFNRDEANNVIIFKKGTKGYENHEPVIIQGHLDMVCAVRAGADIDMEKEFNKHNFPAKLTRIGCVRAGNGKVREFSTGRPFNLEHHGYEH